MDIDDIGEVDDGTMEQPLSSSGTLQSVPRPLQTHRGTSWRTASALTLPVAAGLLAIGAMATTGSRAPQAQQVTEIDRLGAWLAEHPESPDDRDVRVQYADQLTRAQRYPEAFEEYLTVVRRAPTSPEGSSALRSAVRVAEALALAEGSDLWTERWVATVDRYARYWPGDPLTPLLVEETVHSLVARGQVDEAQVLTHEHLHH